MLACIQSSQYSTCAGSCDSIADANLDDIIKPLAVFFCCEKVLV